MKFEPQYFPEESASRDETRAHLIHPHLDVAGKRLVATDGHMLACIPVTIEPGDIAGSIPREALREARSVASKRGVNAPYLNRNGRKEKLPRVRAGKKLLDTGGAIYRRPAPTTFPHWEALLPKVEPGQKGTVTIGVNPNLLVRAAKAIGAGTRLPFITLTFQMPNDGAEMLEPILVRLGDGTADAVACVMPARTSVLHNSKPAKKAEAA